LHGQLRDLLNFLFVDRLLTTLGELCNAIVNHSVAPTANSKLAIAAGLAQIWKFVFLL